MTILHKIKLLIKSLFRTDKSLNLTKKRYFKYTQHVIGKDGKVYVTHHNDVVEPMPPIRSLLSMTQAERDAIMRDK